MLRLASSSLVLCMRARSKCAAFSPDDAWVVTASDDMTARVSGCGERGRASPPSACRLSHERACSADGARVVTASADKTVRIWDAASGTELFCLRHDDWVFRASLSADGASVVTASADKTARIWDASGSASSSPAFGMMAKLRARPSPPTASPYSLGGQHPAGPSYSRIGETLGSGERARAGSPGPRSSSH